MRNLLAFLAAALLTFACLGWYLDWYTISTTSAEGGHRKVSIDINAPKIGEDFEKGGQKVKEMIQRTGNKGGDGGSEAPKKDGDNGTATPKKDLNPGTVTPPKEPVNKDGKQ